LRFGWFGVLTGTFVVVVLSVMGVFGRGLLVDGDSLVSQQQYK